MLPNMIANLAMNIVTIKIMVLLFLRKRAESRSNNTNSKKRDNNNIKNSNVNKYIKLTTKGKPSGILILIINTGNDDDKGSRIQQIQNINSGEIIYREIIKRNIQTRNSLLCINNNSMVWKL